MTSAISPRDWFSAKTPASYGDIQEEYRLLREGAALLDMSTLGKLRVTGDDRLTYLQGQLSQDVLPLHEPGQGALSCLLKPTGQMLSDLLLFSTGDAVLLITPPHTRHTVRQRLEQFVILEDVEIEDISHQYALLHVAGPLAEACLRALGAAAPFPLWRGESLRWHEQTLHLLRTDRSGEQGYDLLVPVESVEPVRQRLREAGAQPAGYEAFQVRRVEAGIPLFGIDMDENTIPLEAGLGERAVSFTKGCYTGQEVIHRIYSRGHTNRSLVGLRLQGEALPPHRAPIHTAERPDAGWVTSAVRSFSLPGGIALGYLRNEYLAPGTRVSVQMDPSPVWAQVTPLPFVEPRRA